MTNRSLSHYFLQLHNGLIIVYLASVMVQKVLCFALLFYALSLQSQNYTPLLDASNRWYITTCYNSCITDSYYSDGDTLVNNRMHKILDGYHYISRTFLLREDVNEKKVFLTKISGNRKDEFLLYDFAMQEGDSIQMNNPITPFPADGGFYKLDSIRSIPSMHNLPLKHFYLSPTLSNAISTQTAVWVEGIGSLSIINAPGGYPDINGAGHVTCFYKNESLFYSLNSSFNTQCAVPGEPLDIFVYYEPNDSTYYVQNTSNVITVTLFDVSGRKVKTFTNSNEAQMALNVSDCSSGIYFLNFQFKTQKEQVVKIGIW